jgi:hypothetical protein
VCHVSNSSNGPLMSECTSLLWALAAIVHVLRVEQQQQSADVRVFIVAVGTSSNHVCATCPTVATVHDVRVHITDMSTNSNHACATCPIIMMGEARPLLLG